MKQLLSAALLVVGVAVSAAPSISASTVYSINVTATGSNPTGNPAQSDTVTGSITTDGTIGVLATADILSWNLSLVDQLNSANNFDLNPGNSSVVEDTGSALSATASGLSFNFSGSGEFLIQANNPGAFSGYHYFCFSTGGACLAGESIAPDYIFTDGVVLTGASAPVGSQPLNPPSPSSVPEPASTLLLGSGLFACLAMQFRRHRTAL